MHTEAPLQTSEPVLSVLLVSYRSQQFMRNCLDALLRHVSVPFEVVLVDNASQDDTLEIVRSKYPWVRTFQSDRNLGFTGGNNLAARHATGKYLLLLNCDTVLLTDVAPGIRILEQDPTVGVVGARMYDAHGDLRVNAGYFPLPKRLWKFTSMWMTPLSEPYGLPELSAFRHDWVEGSFLLTSAANWRAVDGFDESGFMYVEDVEFCGHTAQRGLATVQCSKLMYLHFCGYSTERIEYLYAGYRRFNASYSNRATQRMVDVVLLAGLIPRIAVYGILAQLTGKKAAKTKYKKFLHLLLHWKETAPRASTRRPELTSSRLAT